ncbi:MAG: cell envelope integrity protein CreD [Bacteroidia bacterium]|nr:cell envelope integrity protein CreD [Bacteroidia bacterium]
MTQGLYAPLNWKSAGDFKGNVSMQLAVKGSQRLNFVPVGRSTAVSLKGPWGNPSFDGQFIPESRTVDEGSFSAQWNVSHFNRPFAQQWTGHSAALTQTDFGLRLLVPVEQYQKSMRTAKYSHLIVILTFVALFLLEITHKLRIHAFQYTLVGAALVIYYTLLLSFSEHVGYTWAYVIATVATVGLIALYSTSFLKQFKLAMLLTALMSVYYTFIFVIMVQQDYALLLGSIGLFVVIAALMYFSRNISWYKQEAVQ